MTVNARIIVVSSLVLLIAACSESTTSDKPVVQTDDWAFGTRHDVISQTDELHLVKTLQSSSGSGPKIQLDLTCPTPGIVSAEIVADDTEYVWRQSTNDFVAQQFLGAAGIASNPLSTLIQWRVGAETHKANVEHGKYNNVVEIPKFFSPSTNAPWTGSLAVAVETAQGPTGVEKSIDSPNAVAFSVKCLLDSASVQEREAKLATERQAAKEKESAASLAAKQLIEARNAFLVALRAYWPRCHDGSFPSEDVFMSTGWGDRVRELTEPYVWIRDTQELSDADRAEGYEWKGHAGLKFQESRELFTPGRYDWSNTVRAVGCEDIAGDVWKRGNNWGATVRDSPGCPVRRGACDLLPK
jgi:hypothetical protein